MTYSITSNEIILLFVFEYLMSLFSPAYITKLHEGRCDLICSVGKNAYAWICMYVCVYACMSGLPTTRGCNLCAYFKLIGERHLRFWSFKRPCQDMPNGSLNFKAGRMGKVWTTLLLSSFIIPRPYLRSYHCEKVTITTPKLYLCASIVVSATSGKSVDRSNSLVYTGTMTDWFQSYR